MAQPVQTTPPDEPDVDVRQSLANDAQVGTVPDPTPDEIQEELQSPAVQQAGLGEPSARITVQPQGPTLEPDEVQQQYLSEPMEADTGEVTGGPSVEKPPGWDKFREFIQSIPQADGMSTIGMAKEAMLSFMNLVEAPWIGEMNVADPINAGLGAAGINVARGVAKAGVSGLVKESQSGAGMFFSMIPDGIAENIGNQIMKARTRAQSLELEGATEAQILAKTGFSKDYYGNWIFETSDQGAKLVPKGKQHIQYAINNANSQVHGSSHVMLGDLLDNPELFKTMPDLKRLMVRVSSGPDVPNHPGFVAGSAESSIFGPSSGLISLEITPSTKERDVISTLLHEVQHIVNAREADLGARRSRGTSSTEVGHRGQALTEYIDKWLQMPKDRRAAERAQMPKSLSEAARVWQLVKQGLKDFELYLRDPGEVEARNTSARMDFTPEQRRGIPPEVTEQSLAGVARKDQADTKFIEQPKVRAEDNPFELTETVPID